MVNKCAIFGCKRGYESEEPQHEDYHAFYFPLDERKSHLLPAWEKFVYRDGWKPSANSVICEFHFEDRLIRKGKRWTLKWKLNPMPTMLTDEMKAMPQSVQPTPAAPPRKPPVKRTYQEDEINAFLSLDIIGDFSELNSTHAPPGFQCTKSDNSIVFFNLTYVDGFPVIFESIKVDQRDCLPHLAKYPAGYLAWSDLHQIFEHDVKLQSNLKKAHKLSYQLLHPGNKKQSVPLALAIFHETTTAAFESYFPEREDASKFLKMINTWWLICNSKGMNHPNPLGNVVRVGDGKTDFLEALADWFEK